MPNLLTTPDDQRPVCQAPGCGRDGRLTKGLCSRHYMQVYKHGHLTPERERRPRPAGCCREPGCRKPGTAARGWCWVHYQRHRRAGTLPPSNPGYPGPLCRTRLLWKIRNVERLLAECRKLLDE